MSGVDMHHRERKASWAKCLDRQVQQDGRVLATREQQHGALTLGGNLSHNENSLGFKQVKVVKCLVTTRCGVSGCRFLVRARHANPSAFREV